MASVRLAEVLGALSFGCDLANGYPQGKVLRTAVIAVALARADGLSEAVARDAYYTTILRFLGCTGFSHEESTIYGAGDDISVRRTMGFVDGADLVGTLRALTGGIAPDASLPARARAIARLVGDGASAVEGHARAQCDAAIRLAAIVGASSEILSALSDVCERWDGSGAPDRDAGEALALPTRVYQVADIAELAHARGGRDGMRKVLSRRAGGQLDPRLARRALADVEGLADRLESASLWDAFLAAEPEPVADAGPERVDEVARALGAFVDLKSSFTLGHSSGVARLVAAGAAALGLAADEARDAVRAAHLHDVGRLAVPNSIWDHPGPLGPIEWERVRLHAYTTERILWQSPALRGAARIAGLAHERLDGGGYPKGAPAGMVPRAARLLAAADVVHALGEPRAHRAPLDAAAVVRVARGEALAGRLDEASVDAVLAAAGHGAEARRAGPAGMSERELEVLRLVARGKTNKEIGTLLGISPRTVQNHVAHVYDKAGVYSRAGAALWAIERGVLG